MDTLNKKISIIKQENKERMEDILHGVASTTYENNLIVSKMLHLFDETDFYYAPASTKYHGAELGGLFEHSLTVTKLLLDWTAQRLIAWQRPISPYIVGMLHDVTKVNKYTALPDGGFGYSENTRSYGGHGTDSLIKVQQCIQLTEEEALCIRYHMGAYEHDDWKGFENAISSYQTVLWTHHADMVASKVVGV